MTQWDIAEDAEVSQSAVSRVINRRPGVEPDVAARVWAAITRRLNGNA